MPNEILIQSALILLTLAIFLFLYTLPRKTLKKLRTTNRTSIQSNRHFLQGAQLLTRARSTHRHSSKTSLTHARYALTHADAALVLNPRDPASHILKALTLDHLGRKSAALKSLDAALSPPAVKTLSGKEKADALIKRAEIQIAVNRKRRVESAIADLVEAVGIDKESVKAWCLLGECYEYKGMEDEAVNSYRMVLQLDSDSVSAREGLSRLEKVVN